MGWPYGQGRSAVLDEAAAGFQIFATFPIELHATTALARPAPPTGRHQRVVGVRRALCSARRGVGRSARDGRPPARRGSRGRRAGRVIAARVRPRVVVGLRSGASRTRTGDLLGAIQALSQLSYSPRGEGSRRYGPGRSGEPMSGGVGVGVGTLQIVAASSPGGTTRGRSWAWGIAAPPIRIPRTSSQRAAVSRAQAG